MIFENDPLYSVYDKLDKCHPYPAKFPLKLALDYINKYTNKYDTVYDPFMGSGTTLLASSLDNRISFGTDINSIAVLLSKFKLYDYKSDDIYKLEIFLEDLSKNYYTASTLNFINYTGITHWFSQVAIENLSYILSNINLYFENNEKLKIFCNVVFSSIINVVSNQESDTRYAAIEKPWITKNFILEKFIKKFQSLLSIVSYISRDNEILNKSSAYYQNAKSASEVIPKNSVDLLLTSPPYPNTYDYYLYHKHRMLWLGYDFAESKSLEIGSRNEFSSRKEPESNFTHDLYYIFNECNILLKEEGHIVIVIGDGIIRGKLYNSREHTIKIGEEIGWKLINESFTSLDDTSRSFNKGFRQKGKKEHILEFKK